MSDSIPTQWISHYIIQVAEKFGKSFTEIPIDVITPTKNKRVQIIEFLTYNEDTTIWGRVSDKESVIPVCFTKAAVSQYMKELQGRRLTESKNSIFCIGQLRPIFVPIPVGNNRPKFSEESHIALEAGVVKYIGPALVVCGSPQDIELNNKVRAWVRGLRQGGDGGDVLKCRKQNIRDTENSPPPVHEASPVTDHLEVPPRHIVSELHVPIHDPMREYRKRWIHVKDNRSAHMKLCIENKVQDEQHQLGQLPMQESLALDAMTVVPKPQPYTPLRTPEQDTDEPTTPRISEWSPSVRGSPTGVLPCIQSNGHATAEPSADESRPESFTPPVISPLCPPTPAQRVKQPSTSETRIQLTPPPYDSSFVPAPPSHIRRNIMRRVPRPGLPPSPTDHSGPTQVLVPNSDTSGTQSQSQSQLRSQPFSSGTQSQSQSQLRSQPFPGSQSHRPAFPSQLTQDFKPGQTSTPAVVKQDRKASKLLPDGQPEGRRDGDRASSPGFGFGHDDHQPSGTSLDVQQALKASVIEAPATGVDSVGDADIVAVLQGVSSRVPDEPSNESKRTIAPSTSYSRLIPHVISRATSPHPAQPIASTSSVLLHDAEAWKQPSFMSARKGEGRAAELNEKPSEVHKRKRLSPRSSSPFASQKRRKILDEKMIAPQPRNEDEKSRSSVQNKKKDCTAEFKERSSIQQLSLPRVSRDASQSQAASSGPRQPGHKKRKARLLGYQVDFYHLPVEVEALNMLMNMRHMRTVLLRTGRIRTLGDEVIREGSIYTKFD